MVTPAAGKVVLIPFPFSDLTQSKLRPELVLASAGRGDWIMCQITSNPYGDDRALPLTEDLFERGSLKRESFVRPGKLLTASQNLVVADVGTLVHAGIHSIIDAVCNLLRESLDS